MPHTIAARDGSWATGTPPPAMTGYVTFDEPGRFLYHSTDHPWAIRRCRVRPVPITQARALESLPRAVRRSLRSVAAHSRWNFKIAERLGGLHPTGLEALAAAPRRSGPERAML